MTFVKLALTWIAYTRSNKALALLGHCFLKHINNGRTFFVKLMHLMCNPQTGRISCGHLLLMLASKAGGAIFFGAEGCFNGLLQPGWLFW